MGHVQVKAKIGDLGRRKIVEVDALVDTGATSTVVPRKLADELGLDIVDKVTALTAGGKVSVDLTLIYIELEGKRGFVPAMISDIIDRVLIGVTTLETLGLQVDPVTGRLKEWTVLLY